MRCGLVPGPSPTSSVTCAASWASTSSGTPSPAATTSIADAELIVSEAVGNAIRHTGGPVWVSLGWTSELPVLQVYDIGPGFDAGTLRQPARSARVARRPRRTPASTRLLGHRLDSARRPTRAGAC